MTSFQLSRNYVGYTVNSDTMKEEHLLDAFNGFIMNHVPVESPEWVVLVGLIGEASDLLKEGDQETVSFIINEDIWAVMNQIAPEGCIFGAHDGDGACYGFWRVGED